MGKFIYICIQMAEINLKTLTSGVSEIDVNFNGTLEGQADATIPLNVNLTDGVSDVTPTSIVLNSNELDIEIPPYDLDLTDRFGNVFSTVNIQGNSNVDLRTLTPFDWADLFLNNLTASYSATVENALIQLVNDLISANVFQNKSNIYPFLGGNATDNAQNLRYPFKNFNSGQLRFIGSPTHNSNGITITPGSLALSNVCPNFYAPFDLNVFHYSRTNNGPAGSVADWDSNGFDVDRHYLAIRSDLGINTYVAIGGAFTSFPAARSDGGYHMNGGSGTNVAKLVRNGTTLGNFTDLGANNNARLFTLGGTLNNGNSVAHNSLRNYAAWSIGTRLTDTQITDEYNAWQTFQTSLGRQV